MKQLVQIFLLVLLPFLASAQVKRPLNYTEVDTKALHFGFSVGVNTMDLGIKKTLSDATGTILIPDVSSTQPGFQVQIVSSYRLTDKLDLRFLPGICFG